MPDTSPASSSSSGPAKRACDACHRRKVKCISSGSSDHSRPCKNCSSAGLSCTYNAVPQKKGPKGSRAKVISELRESQKHNPITSPTQSGYGADVHGTYAPLSPAPGSLPPELIAACVDFFFENMYPSQPILHRQTLNDVIAQMHVDIEAYCLVSSLCAYMLIQPHMVIPLPSGGSSEVDDATLPSGQILLRETLRVRKGYDYVENPTILSVMTSFFIFGSYFCLDKNNSAWFNLREATTLAYDIRMHEEDSYIGLSPAEASRRRRLYWLLFVTERAYALQRHRPLTLYSTIALPSADEDPSETVELSGFLHLVQLFRPFDDTFVGFWNKTRVGCTSEWLAQLQMQLSSALPTYLRSTETQAVDLRVSQYWLKTMCWQLSMSQGYLSSQAQEHSMTFNFPIDISRDLVAAAGTFAQPAMEVHGIGLIEKIFDVACTLTDIMSCLPEQQLQPSFEVGPRDYLHQFVSLVSNLRGGRQRYLPLLVSKINDTLPSSMPNIGYSISPQLAPAVPDYAEAAQQMNSGLTNHQQQYDSSGHSSLVVSPFGSPPPEVTLPMAHPQAYYAHDAAHITSMSRSAVSEYVSAPMDQTNYSSMSHNHIDYQHQSQLQQLDPQQRTYNGLPPVLKHEYSQ